MVMNAPHLSFLKRPGFREGLMSAGMAMMAQSDTPGSTVLGNLGRALPVGVQAGREAATREEYDALMEGAPPEMRQLLKILGPRDGAAFMLQQATAQPEGYTLSPGDVRYEGGQPVASVPEATPPPPERPADLRTAIEMAGLDPNGEIGEDQLPAVVDMYERLQRAGASSVNVDTGQDLARLPTAVQAQVVGAGPALVALERYEEAAKAYLERPRTERIGGALGLMPNADRDRAQGELESLQNTVLIQLRTLGELGVIAGPDMDILKGMIGDPLSAGALLRDPAYTLSRIQEARSFINDKLQSIRSNYEMGGTQNDPAGIRQ